LTGRLISEDGHIYNIYFDPPPEGVEVYQRDDDNEETIRKRLKVFYDTFSPIMDFYKKKNIFHELRGDEEKEVVIAKIFMLLDGLKK
jgi:adenylate kinase